MPINDYKQLIVWQKSIELVTEIYQITKLFPKEELYGLISQMRRSSVSIPSNIAEGSRRSSRKDFRNFLLNAYGSASELETQILIARNLELVSQQSLIKAEALLQEVIRMLNKMSSVMK